MYETNAQGGHGIDDVALGPTDIPHTRRTPAAPARAPPRPGERGVTVWDGNSPSMLSPGSTTQRTRGGGPAHKSGSRASSSPSTALNTSAPSLPTHPPRLGPRRAISGDLALSRAISGPRRAISGDLGASLARRHTCSKRKEVGGRRSRPIQSAVVAGFLAPGSSPDGCCAGQQTIGRRDDAPSGTLPPPPGYCRTSALSGGIFPSRFLGPPATPTDFPSPHLRRNHRRDCRRCAPWRLCMSRVPARQGWCQGQLNCQGWCQGQINCLAGAKAQRLSSLPLLPLHSLNFLPLSPLCPN